MKGLPWREFIALTASIAVVGLGLGATLPLTALTLDQRGYGNHIVGMMSAVAALGTMGMVPFCNGWVARFGPRATMVAAVWLAAASVVSMQLTANLWLWALLRIAFGAAMGVLFTVGEAWVNRLAPDAARARVVALYMTTFALFMLLGPPLVAWVARWPDWSFAVCGVLFLLALPGLGLMENSFSMAAGEAHGDWRQVLPRMRAIVVAVGFFALFDTLGLSLLPLFALRHGLDRDFALLSVTVALAGNTSLQFAIGWLADHAGRPRVHAACGVLVCLLVSMMPMVVGHSWWWWSLLFILGGAAGGIYMLAVVACGERFSGQRLVDSSGVVNAVWGLVSFVGPLLTGALMQAVGPNALVWVLLAGAGMFLASMVWERRAPAG